MRQFVTTWGVRPNRAANLDVPPRASITSLDVLSFLMPRTIYKVLLGGKREIKNSVTGGAQNMLEWRDTRNLVESRAMTKAPPHPSSPQAIAHRLKLLRMAKAQSQAAFVRDFFSPKEMSTQRWWNYENMVSVPDLAMEARLMQRFGISADWLRHGIESQMSADLLKAIREAEEEAAEDDAAAEPAKRAKKRKAS